MIPDPHRTNPARIRRTEGPIAVAYQMSKRFIPKEGFVTCSAIRSAVGLVVTLTVTGRLRA